MTLILIEITVILLLTLLNGFLAMAEIAIVSGSKVRLLNLAEHGNKRAQLALQLKESPGDFLSTIQVGITFIGILAGAFGGITLAEHLAYNLSSVPYVAPYATTISVVVIVAAISYISLIFGELVPKRIALSNPENISAIIAVPMKNILKIAHPAVRFLSISTNAILKLLKVRPSPEQPISEEEVRILIHQGILSGVFEKAEEEMIDAVFRLASRRISAIMTPRKEVVHFETSDSTGTIIQKIKKSGHSHYPLCEGGLDNIFGIVSMKDLLIQSLTKKELNLRSAVHEMPNIPESSSALKGLDILKNSGKPVGLVIDEFGGLLGIVTLNDFAGAIVGALRDITTPTIIRRSDDSWLVDGLYPFDELKEKFPLLDEWKKPRTYTTIGGFILDRMGRIPQAGDILETSNYRLEIMDMDGVRIDKVLIILKRSNV